MSCELRTFGKIVELNKVKKYLFGDVVEENWLQKCGISFSPARDILVLAYCNKMIVLESKWSSVQEDDVKITYHVIWQGIPDKCDKEMIRSVFCLPISTSKKRNRSQTTPDWTCIIIGFTSGYVRFYTEMGSLLLSQQLHEEPVISILSQSSLLSQYYNKAEKNEDIYILYKTVICSVFGFVLLNTLNACRNQFARVRTSFRDNSLTLTLTYKKWLFSNQDNIQACAIAGPVPVNIFDHLFVASLCGGFNAKPRNNPPHCQLFVAVGAKPFLGFHYTFENETQPILSEITKAVATKLKSAFEQSVPNWLLGGIRPNMRPVESRMEPAEEMGCRFGLSDDGRLGTSISVSPLGDIAAVTDNFGRISVVDLSYGIVVRMLKGFRDAQCGWLLVEEDSYNMQARNRRVQFLVISVPKKGLIDIWTMQFGPKVLSFNVTKDGRLLNSNYGIIGLYDTKNFHNTCVFIESSGEIKDINIPFYCCLSSKNNDKIRDIHILKNMIKILKENSEQRDKLVQEATNLALNLRTADVIKQAVNSLSSNKFITSDVMLAFVQKLREKLSIETDLLPDDDSFYQNLQSIENLTKLFQFLNNMYELPPDYSAIVDDSECLVQDACDILHLKEDELDKLMTLLPTSRNKQKRVTFTKDLTKTGDFSEFLSAFDKNIVNSLNNNVSNKILNDISDLLCSGIMYSKCDFEDWKNECENCKINQSDLLFLIFRYWLNKPLTITIVREMLNLCKIVNTVLHIYRDEDVKLDWQKVRSQLANSECPLTAITAAMVCRAISNIQTIAQNKEDNLENENCAHTDWETVTQEDCNWNILISQLEDITFLDSVLKYQPKELSATLYCAPYEVPDIILSAILKHGKGSISEFVAKWITSMGLNSEFLFHNDINTLSNEKCSPKKSLLGIQEGIALSVDSSYEAKPITSNEKEVLDLLEKLTAIFPYSLNSDSLSANITWEYFLTWKKQINDLQPLEAAITTLQLIRCSHIKHGCCVLIWSTHLSMICEAATRLINKVGKLPKDRLCKQDVGITEDNLPPFLDLWVKFIDIFTETVFEAEVAVKPVFKYEPLWDSNAFSPKNTVPPLVELTARQKPANQDLLYLLSQCSRTLYFLSSFPLRITRPVDTLFPTSVDEILFTNIQSQETFYHPNPDEKIIVNRCSYLKKLISCVINEILKPYIEPNNIKIADYADKLKPTVNWVSKIFALAHDWSVPVDSLKRHQVYELYTNGYDRLAEEIIPSVNDKEQLGHQLLHVVGYRIKTALKKNVNYYSDFSPSVTTWIKTLIDDRNTTTPVEIGDSLQLALTISNLVPENGKDRNLLNQLLDSLEVINERLDLR